MLLKFSFKTLFFPFVFVVLWLSTEAENPDSSISNSSLNGQYVFMLSKSRTLDTYKVINPNRLAILWKNVNDTIRKQRAQLLDTKKKIKEQASMIETLKGDVSQKESHLNEVSNNIDKINVIGFSFSKGDYSTAVLIIIAVLLLALVIIIFSSAKKQA